MAEDNADFSIGMMLLELIVIIGVVAIIMLYVQDLSSSERVERINIANDLALMVNTLVATPGDAVVQYPTSLEEYTIILISSQTDNQGAIEVISDSKKRARAELILPQGIIAGGTHEKKEDFCLRKEKRTITIKC